MKSLSKIAIGTVIVLVGLVIVAGRTLRDAAGYVRASAVTTVDGLADSLPREVRDRKLDNDLSQVRAELVEHRVKLNQSARQIEQLRNDLKTQTERAERNRRVLVEACLILESATREQRVTVKFATADLPLADFQREIDDLLARRARDTQELAVKREALSRLESRQRQAEQALADSGRALEAAEHEVALLKSRRRARRDRGPHNRPDDRDLGQPEGPAQSVGESLGRLRDEVAQLESRNEAERTIAPAAGRPGGDHRPRIRPHAGPQGYRPTSRRRSRPNPKAKPAPIRSLRFNPKNE